MNVIYVDDEEMLLENFRYTAAGMDRIDDLQVFQTSERALAWASEHRVDVAFLDIEMPEQNGLSLARKLKEIDRNIRIVFVTAYEQYALDAFGVEAIGYLLKPYLREDVEKELEKAYYVRPRPEKKVEIHTMPDLYVTVDGRPLPLGHTKQEELLAFLIDRGESGVSGGDVIANLWPDKTAADSVYWVTMSRLKSLLTEAGIGFILGTEGKKKYIRTDLVECDLYRMLNGDEKTIRQYSGSYLQRYSWAEERNAQLSEIKRCKVSER